MKFNELKQAMDWRRRVGFNGGGYVKKKVLPQPKPKEEAEKVNKARKEKTFEKAKGALENPKEVREMFNTGGSPDYSLRSSMAKRNPTLYNKILELAKKGDIRLGDIRKHPEVLKLNKGKPVMFETVKNSIERGLGKRTLNKIKNLPKTGAFKSETRKFVEDNIDKIKKDYLKGISTTDLSKKYLNESKSNTTLETVLKENVTKKEKAKRPDITGRGQFAPVKKDPKKLAAIIKDIPKMANKEVLEKHKISSTTLDEIKNEYGLKFGKMIKRPKDPAVTERIKKVAKAIEKADLPKTDIDARSAVVKNLAKKLNLPVDKFLGEVSRIKQDPDRFDASAKLKKNLGRFPDPKFVSETLKAKGFAKSTTDVVRNLEKAITQAVSSGSNLEHALPQGLIREFKLPKKYLLTAERTTGFLNQFKKQYDNQLIKAAKQYAAGDISYPDYKKEVARISKIVSDKTGGYKIGYVDFVDGKAVPVTPQESLLKGEGDLGKKTKGLKNYFKNIIHHNTLYDNFKANSKDPAFATLRDEIKRKPGKFIRENEAEKTARAITSFTKPEQFYEFYKKNPDDVFFKALTRTASLLGGRGTMLLTGGASLPFLATALAADTGNEIKEATSVLPTAAVAGTGAAAVGTKTGRNILGKIFRGAGTPLAGPVFAATNVASKMGEGQSFADAVVDPLTGLELSFPGLFKENISKITKSPTLQKVLGLGRFGRMLTPVGLGLATLGQAQEFYNQRQNLQRMREQNPRAYSEFMSRRVAPALSAAEQTAIEDMGRFGAAGGGIMKMAGKSSGRPPESGPTPQGLDFLLKRGR